MFRRLFSLLGLILALASAGVFIAIAIQIWSIKAEVNRQTNDLANKANAAGSNVILQVWPKMVHVFQGFAELPESDSALSLAASFIKAQMGRNEPIAVGTG